MKHLKYSVLFIAVLGMALVSCSDDKQDETSKITLTFNGLENLGSEAVYEGWIIVDGSPISTGTFTVNESGSLSRNEFEVLTNDLQAATTFVLTIEPSPDNDPAPSDVHILAGEFSGNESELTMGHDAAIGTDFSSATGEYILATPTDGDMNSNEESGVWFLDPSGPSPTLDLPTLPAGWIYEGWAVINGTPVSTGTFAEASGDDDSAIYSGSAMAPPFPGEDFLINAPNGLSFPTNLAGSAIVISVEPQPDNSPNPFRIKPLLGQVGSNPVTHTLTSLDNNISNTTISGTAMR